MDIWDVATGQEIANLREQSGSIWSVAFSPDGATLATGSLNTTAKLWDVIARQEIATLEGHSELVQAVAFSPNGATLASGSQDRTVKLWDPTTREEIATLEGHSSAVTAVAFSPDGATLAASSYEEARLWRWPAASGDSIRVSAHNTHGLPEAIGVRVPITIDEVSDLGLIGVEFRLEYDVAVLTATGVDISGALTDGWAMSTTISDGSITVATASTTELDGSGVLLYVVFDVQGGAAGGPGSTLRFTRVALNEGEIAATPFNGAFTVDEVLLRGDVGGNGVVGALDAGQVLQYSSGAITVFPIESTPAVWAAGVLSAASARRVADVSGDGSVSAFDVGLILRFASGSIAQFPVDDPNAAPSALTAPDIRSHVEASSCVVHPGETVTLTVHVSAPEPVWSGQFDVLFDSSALRVTSVEFADEGQDGTLTDYTVVNGRIKAVSGRATPFAGGRFLTITFEVDQDIGQETPTEVRITSATVNEIPLRGLRAQSYLIQPYEFRVHANFPNPFNPETWLPFELGESSSVALDVFNLQGVLVRSFDLSHRHAGVYATKDRSAHWDGRNTAGEPSASGIYVYRLRAGSPSSTGKLVLRK